MFDDIALFDKNNMALRGQSTARCSCMCEVLYELSMVQGGEAWNDDPLGTAATGAVDYNFVNGLKPSKFGLYETEETLNDTWGDLL